MLSWLDTLPVSLTLLACIVIAALFIYVPFLLVAYARFRIGYNWRAPRTMLDKLPDFAQRAAWAHQNAFESFMPFAAAALMAYATDVDSIWATGAAIAYVGARLLYAAFYILDIPFLRSLMFAVSSAATFALFFLSLQTVPIR